MSTLTENGVILLTPEEIRQNLYTATQEAIPDFDQSLPSELINNLLDSSVINLLTMQGFTADLYNQPANFANELYLEQEGSTFNLIRKASVFSSVVVIFTGTVGTYIPQGIRVSNTSGSQVFTTKEDATILASGTISILCESEEDVLGTIDPNTINVLLDPILSVTVDNAVAGNTQIPAETYEEYRQRLLTRFRTARIGTYQYATDAVNSIDGVVSRLVNFRQLVAMVGGFNAGVVECVIGGGDDTEIAGILFNSFLSPILFYSNPADIGRKVTVNIEFNNNTFPIVFTRPDLKNIDMEITITLPIGDILIADAILTSIVRPTFDAFFEALQVGVAISKFTLEKLLYESLNAADYSEAIIHDIEIEISEGGVPIPFDANNQIPTDYDVAYSLINFSVVKNIV